MSRLSRPPRAKVRAGILATAAHEFLTFGYHDARIARIADQAGYTKGALYSNFGSKPQLFTEVLMEYLKESKVTFVPQILEIFAAKDPVDEKSQKLSVLLVEHSKELLPWQVLIAQLRLLSVNDAEAKEAYQNFMDFYMSVALEICEINQLLTNLDPVTRRVYIYSALQVLNTVVLESTTLDNLPNEYFTQALAAILTPILKDL